MGPMGVRRVASLWVCGRVGLWACVLVCSGVRRPPYLQLSRRLYACPPPDVIRFSAAVTGAVKVVLEAVVTHRTHPGVCLHGVNIITQFSRRGQCVLHRGHAT